MEISYKKLWKLLIERDMMKKELHIQELKTSHPKHRKTNLHPSTNASTMSLLIIVHFGVLKPLVFLRQKAFIRSQLSKLKMARLWTSIRAMFALGMVLLEEK